jgi:ABC-type sugar transport system ATPase subunit
MGSGRTELACALYGLDKRISGAIRLGGKMLPSNAVHKAVARGVGLIPENRKDEGILINFSVMKNITISSLMQYKKGGIISRRMEQKYAQTMVDTLHVRTPSLNQMIINLSGGNQQKVIIGRWLVREGLKVLIVDEPTRGIDVGAKAEIYAFLDKLANEGMSIIVMSSEMQEILCMCDRICVMRAGELVGEFNREEATQEVLLKAAMGV